MKVGVMGAGAIGCCVGGRWAHAVPTDEVVLIGRPAAMKEIDDKGLTVVDNAGSATVKVKTATSALALKGCDIVLVCVKSGQTDEVAQQLKRVLGEGAAGAPAVVVSLQNGMGNPARLRAHISGAQQRVLGGVVGFNVVTEGGGRFRKTTTGLIAVEESGGDIEKALYGNLRTAGFDVLVSDDIAGVQWSKLVMNLNNAVSALTDAPTVQLIFEERYRKIVGAVMAEAIAVFKAAGVKPKKLGPLPPSLFPLLLSLPTPLVKVLARAQIQIDPEARSSMWEDLQRRRLTEVDELNGEIVRLAAKAQTTAPLSARIVELVHAAEQRALGSPKMSAEQLWTALHS